ncbi:hypothetical protein HZC00_01735 [Candidatus Kaiserbacteria bacterium]|nr:hypothetical protein [Candidatus Kaiserbacteria bacterium]
MHATRLFLLYLLAVVIVIILGGFVGWYFFLHIPQTKEAVVDAARGLNSSINPFTGGSTQDNIRVEVAGNSTSTAEVPTSALWQVDKTPVAGMNFVKHATSTSLDYIQRANGYVFRADPKTKTVVRLTETLTPKIYEAFVSSDGAVIARSLDDSGSITTFMATVGATTSKTSTSTEQNTLRGSYVAKNISSVVPSPTTHSIFYTIPNDIGGVDGYTALWDGSKPKKIFISIISHWTPLWLSDGRLIITENPADDMPGYAYSVSNDGTMTLLVGNVPGLTFLPLSSSKAVIYGASANGVLSLFAQGAASTTPNTLNIQTVADKCVWLGGKSLIAYCAVPTTPPTGKFLDQWYRGVIHTSDSWWKVDVQNSVALEIYSPKTTNNVDLDVERPTIDPSGNYIAFINASDKSLWMLNIPQ